MRDVNKGKVHIMKNLCRTQPEFPWSPLKGPRKNSVEAAAWQWPIGKGGQLALHGSGKSTGPMGSPADQGTLHAAFFSHEPCKEVRLLPSLAFRFSKRRSWSSARGKGMDREVGDPWRWPLQPIALVSYPPSSKLLYL